MKWKENFKRWKPFMMNNHWFTVIIFLKHFVFVYTTRNVLRWCDEWCVEFIYGHYIQDNTQHVHTHINHNSKISTKCDEWTNICRYILLRYIFSLKIWNLLAWPITSNQLLNQDISTERINTTFNPLISCSWLPKNA